jgi:hypothetical protein
MSYPTYGEHLTHIAPACFADLRKTLFSDDVEVLPLGETALARQFQYSALRRLKTAQLSPTMTGSTKSEDRWGMKLPHRRGREFSRSPEGARTGAMSGGRGLKKVMRK